LYGSLNPGGKIGIRLNVAEFFLGEISESVNNRIGICEDEFDEVYEIAEKYGLTVNGLHVYLGSDIINYDYMKESVVKTIEVSKKIKDLEYIDFGGGFPVQGMHGKYFDYQGYDKFITAQLNDLSAFFDRSIELIIEPGRSLFGESAAFYTSIIDIKERHDQILICCDSSASMFPRSLFYGEYHEVEALNTDEEKTYDKPMSVVGHTTYSRDYLVKNEENFRVQQEGNRLKFLHAGSYCYSMLTNFLGQEVPTEWLLTKENKVICIDDSKKEAVHAS
jgi:diaminopimelate decarboxylase